ncbi:hypothetical protein CYMTET_45765, partial [Cymbomonas tetramitiformis]
MIKYLLIALLLTCRAVDPASGKKHADSKRVRARPHTRSQKPNVVSNVITDSERSQKVKPLSRASKSVTNETFHKAFRVPHYEWPERGNADEPVVWHIGRELELRETCYLLALSSKCLPHECAGEPLKVEQKISTRRLLITGMGRSGTLFSSNALTQLGLNVNHDSKRANCPCPGHDGEVAWPAAFRPRKPCFKPHWMVDNDFCFGEVRQRVSRAVNKWKSRTPHPPGTSPFEGQIWHFITCNTVTQLPSWQEILQGAGRLLSNSITANALDPLDIDPYAADNDSVPNLIDWAGFLVTAHHWITINTFAQAQAAFTFKLEELTDSPELLMVAPVPPAACGDHCTPRRPRCSSPRHLRMRCTLSGMHHMART